MPLELTFFANHFCEAVEKGLMRFLQPHERPFISFMFISPFKASFHGVVLFYCLQYFANFTALGWDPSLLLTSLGLFISLMNRLQGICCCLIALNIFLNKSFYIARSFADFWFIWFRGRKMKPFYCFLIFPYWLHISSIIEHHIYLVKCCH